eukprot:357265-Chlamydomonas_euryale.AAC.2
MASMGCALGSWQNGGCRQELTLFNRCAVSPKDATRTGMCMPPGVTEEQLNVITSFVAVAAASAAAAAAAAAAAFAAEYDTNYDTFTPVADGKSNGRMSRQRDDTDQPGEPQ